MKHNIEKLLGEIYATHFDFSGLDWSNVASKATINKFKKNSVIRPSGDFEMNLYYILEGVTASVNYKLDKLVCIDICFKNEFSGDYQSLVMNQKSTLEIRAITNCTILSIPFNSLLETYRQKPESEVEKIRRINAESLYFLRSEEIIDLKTLSAKERYLKMLKQQPELLQKIPLKYLAAYLSISAESLSRIRKELAT